MLLTFSCIFNIECGILNNLFSKSMTHQISTQRLSLKTLNAILTNNIPIALSAETKLRIQECRTYLDERIAKSETPIYGINTGFGSLYNVKISDRKSTRLNSSHVKI